MEAKDTVMNPHDAIDNYNHFREKYVEEQEALEQPIIQSQADNAGVNGHSLAQAEISFKAGQKAERERIIEYLESMDWVFNPEKERPEFLGIIRELKSGIWKDYQALKDGE